MPIPVTQKIIFPACGLARAWGKNLRAQRIDAVLLIYFLMTDLFLSYFPHLTKSLLVGGAQNGWFVNLWIYLWLAADANQAKQASIKAFRDERRAYFSMSRESKGLCICMIVEIVGSRETNYWFSRLDKTIYSYSPFCVYYCINTHCFILSAFLFTGLWIMRPSWGDIRVFFSHVALCPDNAWWPLWPSGGFAAREIPIEHKKKLKPSKKGRRSKKV